MKQGSGIKCSTVIDIQHVLGKKKFHLEKLLYQGLQSINFIKYILFKSTHKVLQLHIEV